MEQSIGTARLDVVVDKSNAEASLSALNRQISETGKASDDSTKKTEQNSARQIAALKRQAETFGLTREEMVRYRIETQTTGRVQQELLAKLDQSAARLKQQGVAFNQFGVSAKQQAAALRGVPAQVTDIVTALSSGQRPLTVLLQQGGQLKDMFGGIVPAARALGGAVLGLINPFTLAAAAVIGLGVAFKKASDENAAFDKALILTGNTADATAEQLRGMASEIDSTTGVTAGKASEVLAAAAATGKFTADQIQLVATAAANLEQATGRSIQKTISEFAELEKDPVNAILKLNDAIGDGTNVTNFLTQAQIEAIEKFKEQGREAEAAEVAIKAYADAINDRAPEVIENLGLFSRWWKEVAKGAGEAADAAVGMFRDAEDAAERFFQNSAAARNALAALAPIVPGTRELFNAVSQGQNDFSGVKGTVRGDSLAIVDSEDFKKRKDALKEFEQLRVASLNEAQRLELKIKEIRETGIKAGKSELEIQNLINAAKEKGAPKARSGGGRSRSSSPRAAALPDFSGKAAEELERLAQAEARATDSFRDMEAQLQGPMAVALRDHEKRVADLNELARQSPEAAARLSAALELEAQRHKAVTDELKAQQEPWEQTLAAMREQIGMIGLGNTEQAVANDLMREGIDLSSEMAKAKLAEAKAIDLTADAQQKAISFMDGFRQSAADSLADFATGAKSAKDAALDFFDSLIRAAIQAASERAVQAFFGTQGSNGSGTSGGGFLASLAAALFGGSSGGDWFGFWKNGGAFANGVPVEYFARGDVFDRPTAFNTGRGMGVMGEAGPEAIMPLSRGKDGKLGVRMDQSEPVRRGDVNQYNTYNVMGSMDRRAREATRYDNARNLNRAQRRNGT